MSAAHDGEPDAVHVLLHDRVGDHLRRLVETRVDDLEAGVAERPRDDLGAAVVAVLAHLRDEDARLATLGLGGGDLTHPTPQGAEALGDLFYASLTTGFEAWLSRHPDAAKPTP